MFSKFLAVVIAMAATLIIACKKKQKNDAVPESTLTYRNLEDVQMKISQSVGLDIDKDGKDNVYFAFAAFDVQDGEGGRIGAVGQNDTKILVEAGYTICLRPDDMLRSVAPEPREWKGRESFLVEAVIPDAAPNDTTWAGNWLDARRKYIGVQFIRDGIPYMGWICLSMDRKHLTLTLHGCAWRRLNEGEFMAGAMPKS